MPNYNKLHSFDKETLEILEKVPKTKRSEFVRESVKLKHRTELNKNNEVKPTPTPQVRIIS